MKYISLVTEILGGPQAETVKARKEAQGRNDGHRKAAPSRQMRQRISSTAKERRSRQKSRLHLCQQ